MKYFSRRSGVALVGMVAIASTYGGLAASGAFHATRSGRAPVAALAYAKGSTARIDHAAAGLAAEEYFAVRNAVVPPCAEAVCEADLESAQVCPSCSSPSSLLDAERVSLMPSGAFEPSTDSIGLQDGLIGMDLTSLEPGATATAAPEISTAAMVALGIVMLTAGRSGRKRWASWKAPWMPSKLGAARIVPAG